MNTDLPQLEQTIIDIARQELAAVAAFYRKREAGLRARTSMRHGANTWLATMH
ncbi:hypothetical protein P4117_09670 [Pseudomonas aeruginosa]|nr:hypothetical protein [Pseudomonas aeruginosa]